MHKQSFDLMDFFLSELDPDKKLKILDAGSIKLSGAIRTYKELMKPGWDYIGLDLLPGRNVDIVSPQYEYPFNANEFDIIITGQTLEHVAYIWIWIQELYRVLKPGGKIIIIAPSRGHRHCRPDHWRIQPDGMRALLEYAGFKDIKVGLSHELKEEFHTNWEDCYGIAIK